jgi:hypothetical protein
VEGPYNIEQLRSFARRGHFSRHHQVSRDGNHWEPAAKHPEFFTGIEPELRAAQVMKTRPVAPQQGRDQPVPAGGAEGYVVVEADPVDPNMPAPTVERATWYYGRDGKEHGPITFSALQHLAAAGRLRPSDYVWTEGMANWAPAQSIDGLFPRHTSDHETGGDIEEPSRRSGLATASFVFGILGTNVLLLIGSIIAIVCGHVALAEISGHRGEVRGRGLAIAGLVLGYFVAAASLVLALFLAVYYLGLSAQPAG